MCAKTDERRMSWSDIASLSSDDDQSHVNGETRDVEISGRDFRIICPNNFVEKVRIEKDLPRESNSNIFLNDAHLYSLFYMKSIYKKYAFAFI